VAGPCCSWKRDLFTSIVRAASRRRGPLRRAVTLKMRKGTRPRPPDDLEAGRVAQDVGSGSDRAARAGPAADYYSGKADWEAIALLKQAVTDIPVLGKRGHLVGRGRPWRW